MLSISLQRQEELIWNWSNWSVPELLFQGLYKGHILGQGGQGQGKEIEESTQKSAQVKCQRGTPLLRARTWLSLRRCLAPLSLWVTNPDHTPPPRDLLGYQVQCLPSCSTNTRQYMLQITCVCICLKD